MARATPKVESGILLSPNIRSGPVSVGSQQWFSWLADETTVSFFFDHESGSFTARKERRKRGGWYWIAYRSRGGKLAKTYIGRSEDLTPERLFEVQAMLVGQASAIVAPSNPPVQPILSTKFAPPSLTTRTARILERSHLLNRLDESLQVPLTLVTAPAGFGKTTLLAMWRSQHIKQQQADRDITSEQTPAIAWVSLDAHDDEPLRFWSCIWSALRQCTSGQGEQQYEAENDFDMTSPLYSTPQMPIETVLALLVDSMGKSTRPIVLILDDYSIITSQQIHDCMAFLLAHLPPHAHIILTGRSEPELQIGRMRMYGDLLELRIDDLRLSTDEIDNFLYITTGASFSPEERTLLEQRTEGWIAGLYLLGMALRASQGQQNSSALLARFTGNQRALFDYFAEEILLTTSKEMQRFLLSTSILAELTPSLCAALLKTHDWEHAEDEVSARLMLASIEHANLFIIPLDEYRQSYRYHALFREFLQERLQQSQPNFVPMLHHRAAEWYEQRGMIEEAIEHTLAGNDVEAAQCLIETAGEEVLWKKGEVGRVLIWLETLPATTLKDSTRLTLLYAWALLLGRGQLPHVEGLLEEVERGPHAADLAVRGEIAALRARIAGFRGDDLPSTEYSQQALRELPRERALLRADVAFGLGSCIDPGKLGESYRMLAEALHISQALGSLRTMLFSSRYLAVVCQEQGRLTEAEAILQQALHTLEQSNQRQAPVAGIIHIGLAELFYERNELDAALQHAQLGLALGERSCEIKVVLAGLCILALIHIACGEIDAGRQELWRADAIARVANVPWMGEQMALISMQIALLKADSEGFVRAMHLIHIDPDADGENLPGPERSSEAVLLVRAWLARRNFSRAIALLEALITNARANKQAKVLMVAIAYLAVAHAEMGEMRQAVSILGEALALAESEGYARIFLNAGESMRAILLRVNGASGGYARKLLNMLEGDKPASSQLSERESEVLHMLAQGMTNQEIAEKLIVAISTIKVHVRHICHKLGAQNRLQALAIAREKELL